MSTYTVDFNIPKDVAIAVAVSFASGGGDRLDMAEAIIAEEWYMLWANGIVKRPPKHVIDLAKTLGNI